MTDVYNIGIDLGTTTCSVSVFVNGRVQTIPIDNGSKVLQSCVYLGEEAISVGRVAKLKQLTEPERVIYGMKRMLGRLYSDEEFQRDLRNYPFTVKKSESDGILIKESGEIDAPEHTPIELTAILLSQAVKAASAYLKGQINEAVISVPAYYNNVQRNDTINAAVVAGLDTVHLVSEPTAASIAYGLINTSQQERVLVFDLGGGKLDISIIQVVGKTYTVLSCCGDSHFGGDDITITLLEDIAKKFNETYNLTIQDDEVAYMTLRDYVEQAKIALSSVDTYDIDIENVMGVDFHYTLSRTYLEALNQDFFNKCYDKINEALEKGYQTKDDITRVIMIGGCSAMPCIRDHIISLFGKQKVWSTMNANEVVSRGAAIVAGISHDVTEKGFDFHVAMYTTTHNFGNETSKMNKMVVNDITPMDLGIRVSDGSLSPIIPANSSIPCTMRKLYQAHKDNQKYLRFKIYQGVDKRASRCKLISEIVVSIETPGKATDTVVEVSFSLDSNSTLYVEAVEQKTMRMVSKVLDMGSQVLPKESVFALRESVRQSMIVADRAEKNALARNAMSRFIMQSQHYLDSRQEGDDIDEKKKLLQKYREWMEQNQNATKEEYEEKQEVLNNSIYHH